MRTKTVLMMVLLAGMSGMRLEAGEARVWSGSADTDWFNALNWIGNVAPAIGDSVTVGSGSVLLTNSPPALTSLTMNGGTLTFSNWTTRLSATTVTMNSGATITCAGPFTDAPAMSNRVWIACTDLTLNTGAKINVSEKGYQGGYNGPGYSMSTVLVKNNQFGIAHGGWGHCGGGYSLANGYPAQPYGNAEYPETPGSGGMPLTSAGGGHGGGAVRIDATGHVQINGAISSTSTQLNTGAYHGTGGSILISCNTFNGSGGSIKAEGRGDGSQWDYRVCGSGGRIAIRYNPTAQASYSSTPPAVNISLNANFKTDNYKTFLGNIGTLYLPDALWLNGSFSSSGIQYARILVPGLHTWNPASLTLNNAGIAFVEEPLAINVGNDLTVTGTRSALELGTGVFTNYFTLSAFAGNTNTPSSLTVGGNVQLTSGGVLRLYATATNGVSGGSGFDMTVTGDINIAANSWLYLFSHPTNGAAPRVSAATLSIPEANGGIDATANGFGGISKRSDGSVPSSEAYGPGSEIGSGIQRGGAYGGYGRSSTPYTKNIRIYGSLDEPDLPGSGGSLGYSNNAGSSGGGLIDLRISGHVLLNGSVKSDFQSCGNYWAEGSGGAINLHCHTLAGTNGLISASSTGTTANGNRGGGGRIALHYDTAAQAALPVPSITFSAAVTRSTKPYSSADIGTIWLPDSRLLGTYFGAGTIQYGQVYVKDMTEWKPQSLTVENAWVRLINEGLDFQVQENLTLRNSGWLQVGGNGGAYCYEEGGILRSSNGIFNFLTEGEAPSVSVGQSLIMTNNAVLSLYAGATNGLVDEVGMQVSITGQAYVSPGCWIYPYCHPTNGGIVRINVGSLKIANGGGINAKGAGLVGVYSLSTGTGAPGHGGTGGSGFVDVVGGTTYDVLETPTLSGSGGGYSTAHHEVNGAGGGVVWVNAAGRITCEGEINADGFAASVATYRRGGSGGSIYLVCSRFEGTEAGRLSARGGNGCENTSTYHAGLRPGGGRIAIWRQTDAFPMAITTDVGTHTDVAPNIYYLGEDGTVFWGSFPPPASVVVVR